MLRGISYWGPGDVSGRGRLSWGSWKLVLPVVNIVNSDLALFLLWRQYENLANLEVQTALHEWR